ncbi:MULTISPECIES: DUF7119 family protein [Halolamina]|uniref:DUF7119 domain-containing protein n=1 Tax=Halolamina pelagica TaxID=699431 RepID=A0A1I5UB68_9EURY|nr:MULTISPECIES: hypothetical protein [Halolamina]NHX37210.1 hypothetical protein [Halolamina sp. R1-12]SFP92549.1 hypothetical protein SAMN05216277_11238 [Halolamina pelagica]
MPPSDPDDETPVPSTDRRSRVGEPVVRADPEITGERADEAIDFDPDDPESVERAAEVLAAFADGDATGDYLDMLRGAAACAALVRGVGSYRDAAARADGVSVSFIRTWARVHDLPQSVRRHVARGDIAPSAAKHLARVDGTARLDLAWATLDHDLTVREVRSLASRVNDGVPAREALREEGIELGGIDLSLPVEQYRELRREASMRNETPGELLAEALAERYD